MESCVWCPRRIGLVTSRRETWWGEGSEEEVTFILLSGVRGVPFGFRKEVIIFRFF